MFEFPDLLPHTNLESQNVAFVIQRSKNHNVVVYEGVVDPRTSHLAQKPIEVYWLKIDPAYVDRNRKAGIMVDRVELNFLETWKAYGVTIVEHREAEVEFTLVSLPGRTFTMKLCSKLGVYRAMGTINGETVILHRVFVESKENFFGLPTVIAVHLMGLHHETNEILQETITP